MPNPHGNNNALSQLLSRTRKDKVDNSDSVVLKPSRKRDIHSATSLPAAKRTPFGFPSQPEYIPNHSLPPSGELPRTFAPKVLQSQVQPTESPNTYNITLSNEQKHVLSLIMSGKSIFFTGCAGTGKSFLLKAIILSLRQTHEEDEIAVTGATIFI